MSEFHKDNMGDSSTSWHSYPKVLALGHAAVSKLLDEEVLVEEKVDGSQFSFGVFNGEVRLKTKSVQSTFDTIDPMFLEAANTVRDLRPLLVDGWTYRGEYLKTKAHNTLCYDRVPDKHIILFDVNTGHEIYLSYEAKKAEAERLGLEVVPLLHKGKIDTFEQFKDLLERTSILGGQKIEGVVIKNYARFSIDGHALMGKFVSEEFKEVHRGNWQDKNPAQNDILTRLIMEYRTPARWNKAIQHLKERGQLLNDPKDIGPLLKEVAADTKTECGEEIQGKLMDWAWPKISKSISNGLPQWYKEKLAMESFDKGGVE